ncbi:Site-specific recombinase XerD [Pseudomonas arsenicoxydans]|uniref:Site-specific recombinase XerD n=1 Tax=Pseudomonas arsenicoxydans TaxID=702115 RepID=A0A1H0B8U9_9PSED|nr:site-specific integrase [Pseudomonas arsenicoxydans]SDN42074.1 Site-specific recombinase XerD [Pseudomonas arsenicoxydans]
MELVWATEDLVIAGRPYPGLPILLWDTMESCVPANDFIRHYLLRGAIGSKKSWPSIGRALYDFFSFLQAHDLDWHDVDRGEAKSLVAAYRDYSKEKCGLATTTIRQRLHYICKFYDYANTRKWVSRLPFGYEKRNVKNATHVLGQMHAGFRKALANDAMPRKYPTLPKFLSIDEARALIKAAVNPHHRMIIRLALQTGLRREEIATFPVAYIFDPDQAGRRERNIRIHLDPYDGHGMLTKGGKPRDIYVSRRFLSDMYRYVIQTRGEREGLSKTKHQQLFLNQFGKPYANDGKGLRRIVNDIGKSANVEVCPHMLRHTYATQTLAVLQRVRGSIDPLVFLQRQLGHSSIQTTMVYLHLVNELADNAVLAYDDELNDSEGVKE